MTARHPAYARRLWILPSLTSMMSTENFSANPLDGILNQLEPNTGDAPQAVLNLGCPLNNLIQEMANSDPRFSGASAA